MGFMFVTLVTGCGKGLPTPDAMKAELTPTQKGLEGSFQATSDGEVQVNKGVQHRLQK